MSDPVPPLLDVRNLAVAFHNGAKTSLAVKGVSFTIARGETLAIVGESGSGKSVTALSIPRLLPYPAASHPSGEVWFNGIDLLKADDEALRKVRGNAITMVFQEPMTSLNPLHSIEQQIGEVLALHNGLSGAALQARVLALMEEVGIQNAASRLSAYPHQLSGGQRQRVMIAMALANEPDLLIADEPTTALDVTVQAQILRLLKALQARRGMAIAFITHDLGIVRAFADRVVVMHQGEIVEEGKTAALFAAPQHPYTRHLIASEPKGNPLPARDDAAEVIRADNLKVWFPIRKGLLRRTAGYIKAVDGADLRVREGQTLGIVGESGSGKTTLGLALLRLIRSEGPIVYMGRSIDTLSAGEMRTLRGEMQIVFQDPYGSLSPRLTIEDIVAEGLEVHAPHLTRPERRAKVEQALRDVGLDADTMERYPHEFSGGQRQRIAIARAMVLGPRLVMLDEPTSALDMSIQTQIVDLLRELQRQRGLTYLFISHDLRVVRALANDIIVMKDGRIVEAGPAAALFEAPRTDYTKALMRAAFHVADVLAD